MTDILKGPVKKSISGINNEIVIFFHGYGADGSDLISLSDAFSKILPNAVFYSPNAPQKCEMGGLGYQWFPIKQKNDGSLDLNAENDPIKLWPKRYKSPIASKILCLTNSSLYLRPSSLTIL